ncbi:bifunctional adenosylcobinamide kinase/adenosylcobinamide-phosphate guanylyltransferase [Spirilliplanes yamanashiensis]|uniref:Adenosylcobinamide kinase n=1 Tax=Spirilliplanes yamanashiensis TaxID=42233 RepID=A0A8J4DIW5_9ACTN|nr:bifunctional adenosylcobinamide kinase/adenosylcobinamide-phosphate guanylyltransferase [Spirilliplanes yamanashiensis]MDP9816823.1 adenosyl cobinamide kinase/adenosyl cobinamide phosphate guanylyltransferase/NaMN:DMB phosphoribosyltransferase [Spirilliplanes yamanashiensis]GIJ03522.1 hypothetical protein Sya03_28740 [Spirilliplanes yamanashiensis]
MSVDGWNSVLVLGGIRSGKSGFAEALVAGAASVRYVATAVGGGDDPEWLARIEEHQRRRPQSWTTEETGADPDRLAQLLTAAKPDETILVDDLGGWIAAVLDPERQPSDDVATVAALAEAVRASAARVVLVSPEVGLSLVPMTPVGRAFADALGTTNQAVAQVCDRVAFVVAGQATWLKPSADGLPSAASVVPDDAGAAAADAAGAGGAYSPDAVLAAAPTSALPTITARAPETDETPDDAPRADAFSAPTMALPLISTGTVIAPGMDLPLPDDDAGTAAAERLLGLDLPGAGLGALRGAVEFAARTQGTATPRPWRSVAVIALHGTHAGGAAAGADAGDTARRAAEARDGHGPLARLAAEAGATVDVVDVPAAGAMESGLALDPADVDAALRTGWELADAAVDAGADAVVLAAFSAGAEAAAAAVVAATTGAEPVAVLGRVGVPGGYVDDAAWMRRCAAVRDALHRIRQSPRGARDILTQLGGGDIAVATGVLLGSAARRTPVLVDGPVGIAAGLVARDFAHQTRHWYLLPDHGGQPAVRQGADVLGLDPVLELRLDLGEGANALAALPLLNAAIGLAGSVGAHPGLDDASAFAGPDGA